MYVYAYVISIILCRGNVFNPPAPLKIAFVFLLRESDKNKLIWSLGKHYAVTFSSLGK